jgi:hypothetical protein
MGDFLSKEEGIFVTGSLNDMFGPTNIAATFARIEQLRKTFPHLFNPANNPGPKAARRQTLRFAAFLINDEVQFDGTYPAPKFKQWLKWLTWLGAHNGGTLTLNNANVNGTASQLILKVLALALPPGGNPTAVRFGFTLDNSGNQFGVSATTTNPLFHIDVTSVDHTQVTANSDDEDDV